MKINIGFLSSSLRFLRGLGQGGLVAGLAVLLLAAPGSSFAQETASSIRGKIVDSNGQDVASATVIVEDTRTGVLRGYTTNDAGVFLATNLPVGGPYKVTVNGVKSVMVSSIALGDTYNLSVAMQSAAELEEIIVLGQAGELVDVAAGPAATFSSFELDTAVAFGRDITDIYGVDPRLNIDFDGRTPVTNCGGKHPRFNSVTLDGVSQSDRFGLNNNGYSTATGMPFPYEAIEQVAVELAPFDVGYGSFSACNINAVTKSGTNEWHGSAFYEYTTETLRGNTLDRLPDVDFRGEGYKQEKKGFSIGGPILEDRLFVFAAYEESSSPRFLAQGYDGSGNGIEKDFLSQADYDRIVSIAQDIYGYDPGGMPGNGASEDEKYMVRLDWNINDSHNASVIYNYYDGYELRGSDSYPDTFEFANHFYTKGAESKTLTFKLASQWSDAFSTELFYSSNEMNDSQVTVGPKDIGEITLEDFDGGFNTRGRNSVFLGADDSRQANSLSTESEFLKLTAQYLYNDHVFTVGYEREELTIFNIFVQHSRGGEWDFEGQQRTSNPSADCASATAQERYDRSDCNVTAIDMFELGRPADLYYGSGGGSNNPLDAAANFTNTLNTFYVQDELYLDDYDLTIVAGLRYDWFESSDKPAYNETFSLANGFRNDANIDGLDLLMPRIGFTWEAREDLSVRGGIGLYSGGNPNVWISNAWSNDGLTNVQWASWGAGSVLGDWDGDYTYFGDNPDIVLGGAGRPLYDIPQDALDYVASVSGPEFGVNSRLVVIDPNYEQPSEWKFALGATWDMPWWGITADIDYLHTKQNDPAIYVDVSQTIVGFTTLGVPRWDSTNGSQNYMLTNSKNSGESDMFSFVLKKDFDFGLDLSFGYAYTDATDVSGMTSFVAGSNFSNLATNDIGNPVPATSNYVTPHRITMRASYGHEFFRDLETRFTMYGYAAEGQPGTYVAQLSPGIEDFGNNSRALLYVPAGGCAGCIDDPNIMYDEDFDAAGFFAFVARTGLEPGFVERNSIQAKWSTRFDIRIDQELPTFIEGTRARAFMKMYNFGNFLNDKWGEVWDAQFSSVSVVEGYVNSDGVLVYEDFNDGDINDFREENSLWEIRLGVDISF